MLLNSTNQTSGAKKLRIPYAEAAPTAFIGASNFFELAIAVSTILFGVDSGVTLAITVGVLVEVPVMLSLVEIMKRSNSCHLSIPTTGFTCPRAN